MKTMCYNKASVYPLVVLALAAVLLLTAEVTRAQALAQVSDLSGLESLRSMRASSSNAPALQQRIALHLQEASLEEALEEVARRGNLGLSYSSDMLPDRHVSLKVEQSSVAEVLRALLAETDLAVYLSPQDEIVVVRAETVQALEQRQTTATRSLALRRVRAHKVTSLALPRTITGQVTNSETDGPLPGVNVVVEGTTVGTTTDANGRYELEVPDDAETLVFSFVGFVTRRVRILDQSIINVALDPDVAQMEEMVVVGYGTQQRAEVTGSITSISAEDIEGLPTASFEEALQGRLAGVQVQQPTGEPGASPTVRVRGTGSITAGNDPLYVIDGMPIARNEELQGGLFRRRASFRPPPANPLGAFNSSDIESIEVLKDASATAIYGSRGSNGVIMITTKKGRRYGDPVIRFDSYFGMQEATNVPDLMNAGELIEYAQDARNNNYIQNYDPLNPESPDYNPDYDPTTNDGRPDDDFVLLPEKYVNYDGTDTDWLDLVLSQAPMASTSLSIAGGAEHIGYFLSAGYLNQQGIVDGSGYKRYSVRANVEADPMERMQVGAHVNVSLSRQDRLPAGSPYFARPPGIIYSAMVHSPVIRPYDEDGEPNQLDGQSYLGGGTTSASNPLAIMNAIDEELDDHRTFGNVFAQYELLDGLSFRTMLGADLVDYTRSFYRGNSLLYRTAREGEPYAQSSSSRSFNWISENTLTYGASYGSHNATVLAGFTAQRERNDLNSIIAQNFPDDEVKTVNGGQVTDGNSIIEEWALLSYLGRVNYNYEGKYLLTATFRADQSSRFGANNRTGYFPSISAGWRIAEESFMDGLDMINNLKLRVSYGVTGNFLIPNYGSISLLNKSNYILGGDVVSGTVPATLGDDELTWETTRQFNTGLDVAFWGDRLYFSLDYYRSRTSDLLLNLTIPAATGYSTVLTNIGEVENEGLEFSITSRNIDTRRFTWTTDFNIATNRNEVVALGPSGDPILSSGGAGIRHITQIGSEIGSYYGYVVEGVYQSEEEIANAPPDALAQDPRPGDLRYKDVNGDGVITADDRTVTGSYQPDYTFGLINSFEYMGFDLSVFVDAVQGREILNLTARHLMNGEANFGSYAILNDRWRSPEDPGSGEVPRADRQTGIHGNNNRSSSYQVQDGSYVRLRNVTLGYRLPSSLRSNLVREARIYVTGQNLLTSTDYIGFNPEVNNQSFSSLTPGEDYGAYPLARTYTVGVNLTF